MTLFLCFFARKTERIIFHHAFFSFLLDLSLVGLYKTKLLAQMPVGQFSSLMVDFDLYGMTIRLNLVTHILYSFHIAANLMKSMPS